MYALLLLSILAAGRSPDTVTVGQVQAAYEALVQVVTVPAMPSGGDSIHLVTVTDKVPSGSLLAGFLRAHGTLLLYLANDTPGAETRGVESASASLAVRDSVIAALRTDSGFNARALPMLASYWRAQGRVLQGYERAPARSAVLLDRLREIAVRFFFPDSLSPLGDTLYTHICGAINGLGDLPEAADPLVAGFVFAAVSGAVLAPRSPLMKEFDAAVALAKKVSGSADRSVRVHRAQGALWAQLATSTALTRALERAYRQHGAVLPFRLVNEAVRRRERAT